jgi:methionyl-tRNA formyltransferase
MLAQSMRIVFMGTPDFAVASLEALVTAGMQVVAVVTAPDKPAGRGLLPTQSAVKKYAESKQLTILQPEKLKDPLFLLQLQQLEADIQVVVAFRMLPEVVWNMPPLGTINVHASLLPQYRGAAPIHRAIMNGEEMTGVTIFRLQHAIDTGGILLQESIPIGENDTLGQVYEVLSKKGAMLLVKTLELLARGELEEQPQESMIQGVLHHAPKLFTEDCMIDWNRTTKEIHNQIRGLSPHPGAMTRLDGKTLKIFAAQPEVSIHSVPVGKMETDGKSILRYACVDGWLHLHELQLEGKKRMMTTEFLRGYRPAQENLL